MAVAYDLEMIRGDTLAIGLRITNLESDQVTGIFFTIRKVATDSDYVVQKSIGDGITPGLDGYYRIRVAPEDTYAIAAGRYVYDLQINVGIDVYTPVIGKIRITQDVTY